MPNAKKEKELCLGIKKISAPRPYKGVVNKKYYEHKLNLQESTVILFFILIKVYPSAELTKKPTTIRFLYSFTFFYFIFNHIKFSYS